jgi:hypothetical protein
MQTREGEIERRGHIANVAVGKALVDPAAPSHTAGIKEGNRVRPAESVKGLVPIDAITARGTAERSTGINARRRNPIDRRSPNLSPA